MTLPLCIKELGRQDYQTTWSAMLAFTENRMPDTIDELWLVEHPPVLTLGQKGDPKNILDAGDIPVIPIDRGGEVTYHGPGQLVAYVLIDLKRHHLGIRGLVKSLESIIQKTLSHYEITSHLVDGAPGVYVDNAKIAAIGLRVKKYCTYHGISLNVDMDLSPFSRIHPCGYENLTVTQIKQLIPNVTLKDAGEQFTRFFCEHFAFDRENPPHIG